MSPLLGKVAMDTGQNLPVSNYSTSIAPYPFVFVFLKTLLKFYVVGGIASLSNHMVPMTLLSLYLVMICWGYVHYKQDQAYHQGANGY